MSTNNQGDIMRRYDLSNEEWKADGVWEGVFKALSSDYDPENLSLDLICAKVHQSANGGKKGQTTKP